MNLLSKDLDPIGQCMYSVPFLFTAPVELLVMCLILLVMIGWEALLGIGYMLLCTLLRCGIARVYRKLRRHTAFFTDQRLRLLSEVISGIRAIKMNVWEGVFEKLFKNIRRFVPRYTVLTRALTYVPIHALTHARTHALAHARTNPRTHARTHPCTHPRTHAHHSRTRARIHARTHARMDNFLFRVCKRVRLANFISFFRSSLKYVPHVCFSL